MLAIQAWRHAGRERTRTIPLATNLIATSEADPEQQCHRFAVGGRGTSDSQMMGFLELIEAQHPVDRWDGVD